MRRGVLLALLAAAIAGMSPPGGIARAEQAKEDPLRPRHHFTLKSIGQLDKADARTVYDDIVNEMARGYALSGDPVARHYRRWRRYNDAPYPSETHGNRYVNNYANAVAERGGYGRPAPGKAMPPGAIIAKDSFTFTKERAVYAGALFIMEKLAPGTDPDRGDWRYLMIMPDGSVFGDSANSETRQAVRFCYTCHGKQVDSDSLYFLPEAYRLPLPGE